MRKRRVQEGIYRGMNCKLMCRKFFLHKATPTTQGHTVRPHPPHKATPTTQGHTHHIGTHYVRPHHRQAHPLEGSVCRGLRQTPAGTVIAPPEKRGRAITAAAGSGGQCEITWSLNWSTKPCSWRWLPDSTHTSTKTGKLRNLSARPTASMNWLPWTGQGQTKATTLPTCEW